MDASLWIFKIVPGTEHPVSCIADVKEFVDRYGCPIILKAAYGGGGRGNKIS